MAEEKKKPEEGEEEITPDERSLEEMTLTLKNLCDKHEGMEERLKEQYGADLKAAQEEMDEEIKKVRAQQKALEERLTQPAGGGDEDPDDFAGYGEDGMGDFLGDVVAAEVHGKGPSERLLKLQRRQMEVRRLDTLSGADSGWLMPPKWDTQILQIPDDGQYMASLCKTFPAGDPPNAELKLLALDQTGSKGIHGGVAVYHATEAVNLTATSTAKLKFISWKPEKTGAYWQVTEECRANTAVMVDLMGSLVQGAIAADKDDKIQSGTGAGEFLGFDGCDAEISVSRAVSSEVNMMDLFNMMARVLARGPYVWMCNRVSMLPQLASLTDGSGQLIWARDARTGLPEAMLMGIPIFFNEISPALGSAGDLRLINLSYYGIKPGMGASIKSDSTYSNFLSGIETLKVSYYADGKPWLTDALTLRDGTNTVSPFVSLAA